MTANEVKESLVFCIRLYALLPELRTEYNEHRPECNDEKSLNETLTIIVSIIESINAGNY